MELTELPKGVFKFGLFVRFTNELWVTSGFVITNERSFVFKPQHGCLILRDEPEHDTARLQATPMYLYFVLACW
jgi:hypothetical protein